MPPYSIRPPAIGAILSRSRRLPGPWSHASFLRSIAQPRHQQLPLSLTRYASSNPIALKNTPYHDLHLSYGATLVPFAGYNMPVTYRDQSHIASHLFTRTHASLFDVSHMVQSYFTGPGAAQFLERVTPADLQNLPAHSSTLATLLWPETGGIVDDAIITKLEADRFYIVTNAACRDKDNDYFRVELARWASENKPLVERQVLDGWGLLALQGPLAAEVLTGVLEHPLSAPSLSTLFFGSSRPLKMIDSSGKPTPPLLVSRAGYTGEDGFEISIPPSHAVAVAEALLSTATDSKLRLAGLGARDSLRLEAGMCLYGHDLDDTTTPVEASLRWTIAKARQRPDAGFNGAERIASQLKKKSEGGAGVERRRVGLLVQEAPAREGAVVMDAEGKIEVGKVTSGAPSPTLGRGKNIAMAYVKSGKAKVGTELSVVVRGKRRPAVVTKMPFIETKYWKGTTA